MDDFSQNTSTCSITQTESESFEFDISQSYMRSDIENIIRKMYTPMTGRESSNEHTHCRQMTGNNITEEPETYCGRQEPNKRFGFYFEKVTRNEIGAVLDSSTSDSVSLPSVRKKLHNGRVYCACCRKKVTLTNKNQGEKKPRKSRSCEKCNREKELTVDIARRTNFVNGHSRTFLAKGQGDFVNNDGCNVICPKPSSFYQIKGCCQSSPAMLLNTQVCSLNKGRLNYPRDQCESNALPHHEEHVHVIQELDFGNTQENVNLTSNLDDIKISHVKSLRRFIRNFNWSTVLRKTKPFDSTQTEVANDDTQKLRAIGPDTNNVVCEQPKNMTTVACQKGAAQQNNSSPCRIHERLLSNTNKTGGDLCRNFREQQRLTLEQVEESAAVNPEKKISTCQCPSDVSKSKKFPMVTSSLESNKRMLQSPLQEEITKKEGIIFDHVDNETQLNMADKSGIEVNATKDYLSQKDGLTFHSQQHGFYHIDYINANKLFDKKVKDLSSVVYSHDTDWATKFWDHIFGYFHILLSFFTAFVLQLLKFVLYSLVYPLVWGTVQIWSYYFFKPCLEILFVGVVQPLFTFLQNVATTFTDLCKPIVQCFGDVLAKISVLCKACRLVEVHKINRKYGEHGNP